LFAGRGNEVRSPFLHALASNARLGFAGAEVFRGTRKCGPKWRYALKQEASVETPAKEPKEDNLSWQ